MRTMRVLAPGIVGAGVMLATACSSSGGAPQVSDAIPRQIDRAQRTFVLIEGDNFARGAGARLGSSPLNGVTWVNRHVLTAEVPAGLPPGSYDVTVDNPGGGRTTLVQAVTVSGAARGSQPAPATSATSASATRAPTSSGATGGSATAIRTAPPAATTAPGNAPPAPTRSAAPTRTEPPTQRATEPPTRQPTQPPTQRPTEQPTQPAIRSQSIPNVAGTWMFVDTVTYGAGIGGQYQFQVTIRQNGAQLSGGGAGLQFTGVVAGSTIHLDYVQDNGPTGTFDWRLSPDGASFDGSFTNSTGNGGDSTGRRLGSGEVSLVSDDGGHGAPAPPAPHDKHGKKKDH